MMRNFFIALTIVAVVGSGVLVATPASAQTASDLQTQIRELLAKVAELTRQLNVLKGQNISPQPRVNASPIAVSDINPAGNIRHRVCNILKRNLARGSSGDDVKSLQEFLREEGHFSADATGYFGSITASALARWQAANDVESVGVLGPITRERIRAWCTRGNSSGGGGAENTERFGAEPQRGVAPLTVTFKTNVQLANSQFIADAGDYKVVFGDGSEYAFPCSGSEAFCPGPHRVEHTYTAEGTYTAELVHFGYFGIPGPNGAPEQVVGSIAIYVGTKAGCTKEYKPVCGAKRVQCITTPCNPVQETYGNRCLMEEDGAAFLYEGQCRADADPSADARCRVWFDGCNTCSRTTPGGLAACTLRYCFQQAPAYCTAHFDNASTGPVACTADAKQCPDGSYVGRTGPNCEFVCSN